MLHLLPYKERKKTKSPKNIWLRHLPKIQTIYFRKHILSVFVCIFCSRQSVRPRFFGFHAHGCHLFQPLKLGVESGSFVSKMPVLMRPSVKASALLTVWCALMLNSLSFSAVLPSSCRRHTHSYLCSQSLWLSMHHTHTHTHFFCCSCSFLSFVAMTFKH